MRPLARCRLAVLALLAEALALAAAGADAGRSIRLVDDRGRPLSAAVEACHLAGTSRACRQVEAGAVFTLAVPFDTLTLEGPEHGPATLRSRDLPPGPAAEVRVPRKARLRVSGALSGPLGVSLYEQGSADFRRPSHRLQVTPGAPEARIPAGDFLASLSAAGRAPDLHLLSAAPGQAYRIEHAARPGWSLAVRATDAGCKPLAGAWVEVGAAAGYDVPAAQIPARRTGRGGLAVFSGLAPALARAQVRAEGFVSRDLSGLAASPGTFSFREIPLDRPGRLRAEVTVSGQPAAGTLCQLSALAAPAAGRPLPAPVHEARTDAGGTCRAGGLVPGDYALRVRPQVEGRDVPVAALEPVRVDSGEEASVAIALEPARLAGSVTRGGKAAPDFLVEVLRSSPPWSAQEVGSARADEEGRYEATLWTAGPYLLVLKSPAGRFITVERVDVSPAGTEHDFRLAAQELEGAVRDDSGAAVAHATVMVRWNDRRFWSVRADEQGTFRFPLEDGGGRVELRPFAEGYEPAEPVAFEVPADGAPPPALLVLKRARSLSGLLATAGGAAVAGGRIWAYRPSAGGSLAPVGSAVTDGEGRFTLPAPGAGSTLRIFLSGPGCPLRGVDVAGGSGPGADTPLQLTCPDAPASLALTLLGSEGEPLGERQVILRHGASPIPAPVLAGHLGQFGLAAVTDGAGRLSVPALEPGPYDAFLAQAASPQSIAAGLPHGHLLSAHLDPLALTELQVTFDRAAP